MKTVKKIIKLADVSRRHFNYLLLAERNATPTTAKRLERATGIPKELWVFGTQQQRQRAWKQFVSQHKNTT